MTLNSEYFWEEIRNCLDDTPRTPAEIAKRAGISNVRRVAMGLKWGIYRNLAVETFRRGADVCDLRSLYQKKRTP